MNIVTAALAFSRYAHRGQVRKFTGEPFVWHPTRVAGMVTAAGGTDEMIAAAHLHDTIEDGGATPELLEPIFGPIVASYVVALTNEYTYETHPSLSRESRKRMERYRLQRMLPEVQTIKMADIADNARGLAAANPRYASMRLLELRNLADVLDLAADSLRREVDRVIATEVAMLRIKETGN